MFELHVQNDVCVGFDTRRLFSHLSADGGKFFCAHQKSDFEQDLQYHNKFGANPCLVLCN